MMPIASRSPAVHIARRRSDRDQARDHAVDAADQRRLAARHIVPAHPAQERDGAGEVGVQHGGRRARAREVRIAAVEAVPAEPQQAGAGGDHQQVVRCVDLAVALQPRPDHRRGDEAGHARGEVDHIAARVVERAVLGEPAAAPDRECVDGVDQARPQQHERDPGLEVEPPQHGAEHQQRRDTGEDELEVDQRGGREVKRRAGRDQRYHRLALLADVAEHVARMADDVGEEAMTDSEQVHRLAERHAEAVQDPADEHDRKGRERHHHRVHRPALLHHAAVEDDEAGHAHQAHERGGRHLPGVIAWVQPVGIGSPHATCSSCRFNERPRAREPRKRGGTLAMAEWPNRFAGRSASPEGRAAYACPGMPLEGHWARQQAPLQPRQRRAVAGVLALVVAGVLALLLTIHGGSASAPGCVDATIASTTGGASVHACGERAVRLCGAADATAEIRDACRRARIAGHR